MPEQLPKWCLLLDEWLAMAEKEMEGVEKGAVPPHKNTKLCTPHTWQKCKEIITMNNKERGHINFSDLSENKKA